MVGTSRTDPGQFLGFSVLCKPRHCLMISQDGLVNIEVLTFKLITANSYDNRGF